MHKARDIVFSGIQEVITAFQFKQVALHAQIKLRLSTQEIVDTTVGRVIII